MKIKMTSNLPSVCKCATKYHNAKIKETYILLTKWKLNQEKKTLRGSQTQDIYYS